MSSRRRRSTVPLPLMMTELAMASWETIAHRSLLIAQGTCSAAEWQRMVAEKAKAAERSLAAMLAAPFDQDAMANAMAPWHRAAKANAARLRRK